jgi:hypothetical protein
MFEWFTLAQAEAPKPADDLNPIQAAIVTREWEKNEAIRKRLEKKFADMDKPPDPHADMWDPNWIKKL